MKSSSLFQPRTSLFEQQTSQSSGHIWRQPLPPIDLEIGTTAARSTRGGEAPALTADTGQHDRAGRPSLQ